jgi:hypothetical protein
VRSGAPFQGHGAQDLTGEVQKLADVLDDLHEFVQRVALPAGEVD